jgi:hypothetical protein
MATFFGITKRASKLARRLSVDYSFDEVEDPMVVNYGNAPSNILKKFSYAFPGYIMEDMLQCSLSWNVFSPRLIRMFRECSNSEDLQFLELPAEIVKSHPELQGYCVMGIRRQIACIDKERSELKLSEHQQVDAVNNFVLTESSIGANIDVFYLAEYPVIPVISSRLALAISTFRPSGFRFIEMQTSP